MFWIDQFFYNRHQALKPVPEIDKKNIAKQKFISCPNIENILM